VKNAIAQLLFLKERQKVQTCNHTFEKSECEKKMRGKKARNYFENLFLATVVLNGLTAKSNRH